MSATSGLKRPEASCTFSFMTPNDSQRQGGKGLSGFAPSLGLPFSAVSEDNNLHHKETVIFKGYGKVQEAAGPKAARRGGRVREPTPTPGTCCRAGDGNAGRRAAAGPSCPSSFLLSSCSFLPLSLLPPSFFPFFLLFPPDFGSLPFICALEDSESQRPGCLAWILLPNTLGPWAMSGKTI